jgi:hypothetical protein
MPAGTENADAEALRAEVERLRRELVRQRDDFHRELMRKAYRIADLEQGQEEVAAREASNYESSLSWKLTRPLRVGKRVLRRR